MNMIDHTDSILAHLDDYRYKGGIKDLQAQFYKKYSEPYCDNLDWLKMQWGYVEMYVNYLMGDKDINILDALMGKTYLQDLMEAYGSFLD